MVDEFVDEFGKPSKWNQLIMEFMKDVFNEMVISSLMISGKPINKCIIPNWGSSNK